MAEAGSADAAASGSAQIRTRTIPGPPDLAVDEAGEGPLLIFLHGIGGNRTNWAEQVVSFAGDGFTAVAWDARGYGDSDDYDGPLDFGDFARDLIRVMDHYGAEKAHLCGLSMGGRIAQDFIARYPARVATLVLVATHAGFSNFSPEEQEKIIALRLKPLAEEGKEPVDIAPVVAASLRGPDATEEQYQRLVASMAALHKDSYMKTVRATALFNRTAELDQIEAPTLLVYGENDPLTGPEIGEELHRRITGSLLTVIPRAGHLINLEKPAAFEAAIRPFLAKHRDLAY